MAVSRPRTSAVSLTIFPYWPALPTTGGAAASASIAAAEVRLASIEKAQAESAQRAQDNAAVLNKTVLTITHQAGEDGRLFGSVTTDDISAAIKEARGLNIDRRHIHLDDPIKTVGTHVVTVEVAPGVQAQVKTMVVEQR